MGRYFLAQRTRFLLKRPSDVTIAVLAAAACGAVAFFAGVNHRKKVAEDAIGGAEQEAKRIVSDAIKTAEAKKKEMVLEGKDEIHRLRNESERELNDRRKEIQRQERRLSQKEESLDKKIENVENKENAVDSKMRKAEDRLKEAESVKKSQIGPPSGPRHTAAPCGRRNRGRHPGRG